MTEVNNKLFVSHIGVNRINLGGNDVKRYSSLPNTKLVQRSFYVGESEKINTILIVEFEEEEDMLSFVQKLIDQGTPFTDNPKSTAYMEAISLKEEGKLHGEILGC